MRTASLACCTLLVSCSAAPVVEKTSPRDPLEAAFRDAETSGKLVLLDLGTGWCHWCHVMEETTYKDPAVSKLLEEHFVFVRVDADARLDLANRYEDYGWPATIIFDAKKTELVKRRGYIPPAGMAKLLTVVIADPTPGPSATPDAKVKPADSAALSKDLEESLRARLDAAYDEKLAGWGDVHKFLDVDAVELCMRRGLSGDAKAAKMARDTLTAERRHLVDPVWGGAYQYSHGGNWENPHFEKIMARQAADLEAFALAYAMWADETDRAAALAIERYLASFLTSQDGAFYASQDADLVKGEHSAEYFALPDAERRKEGIPEIDRHVYARENGWAIAALCVLHAATGEEEPLERAKRAADRILATRSVEGGFKHGEEDALYAGDTIAMGNALLRLFLVTGEKRWLDRSSEAARFLASRFRTDAGFGSPKAQLDENVSAARWLNLLHQLTNDPRDRELAEHAMRFLASPDATARRGFFVAGVLLAHEELSEPALHATIRGARKDPVAVALRRAALHVPTTYSIVEWTPSENDGAAALLCGKGVCRPPTTDTGELARIALELLR